MSGRGGGAGLFHRGHLQADGCRYGQLFAGWGKHSRLIVDLKEDYIGSILVGCQEPVAGGIDHKIAGCVALG